MLPTGALLFKMCFQILTTGGAFPSPFSKDIYSLRWTQSKTIFNFVKDNIDNSWSTGLNTVRNWFETNFLHLFFNRKRKTNLNIGVFVKVNQRRLLICIERWCAAGGRSLRVCWSLSAQHAERTIRNGQFSGVQKIEIFNQNHESLILNFCLFYCVHD